jgi:type-2 restriction enzyme eco47I
MATQSNLSLNDFNATNQEILDAFTRLTGDTPTYNDLKIILSVGLNDRSLFPNIRLSEGSSYEDYLEKWIKGYDDATQNPPSLRKASPKGSCSDPAIQTIVQIATATDSAFAERMSAYHNLFMSAENIQGNLLEEYISKSIHPYGWVWCNGNVLRAIDFCSSDGAVLLQIKNKSNTENSSSSAIRTGTDIKKWYRLGTQTRNGEKLPTYKWDGINAIVNSHVTSGIDADCNMSEESYQEFLRSITSQNTDIVSDK